MEQTIVVRGVLRGSTQIVLDQPVDAAEGPVEVVVRPLTSAEVAVDVFEFITHLPPGTCMKSQLDSRMHEERADLFITGDVELARCAEIPVEIVAE